MTPAMCGVAIEVPERVSDWLPGMKPLASGMMQPPPAMQVMPLWAEMMLTPGAAMSGLRSKGGAEARAARREAADGVGLRSPPPA